MCLLSRILIGPPIRMVFTAQMTVAGSCWQTLNYPNCPNFRPGLQCGEPPLCTPSRLSTAPELLATRVFPFPVTNFHFRYPVDSDVNFDIGSGISSEYHHQAPILLPPILWDH